MTTFSKKDKQNDWEAVAELLLLVDKVDTKKTINPKDTVNFFRSGYQFVSGEDTENINPTNVGIGGDIIFKILHKIPSVLWAHLLVADDITSQNKKQIGLAFFSKDEKSNQKEQKIFHLYSDYLAYSNEKTADLFLQLFYKSNHQSAELQRLQKSGLCVIYNDNPTSLGIFDESLVVTHIGRNNKTKINKIINEINQRSIKKPSDLIQIIEKELIDSYPTAEEQDLPQCLVDINSNTYINNRTLLRACLLNELLNDQIEYLYFLPVPFPNGLRVGHIALSTSKPLQKEEISRLRIVAYILLYPIIQDIKTKHDEALILREAIKSAIAAIMSRNMSHNLGSHVVTNAKHQIMELERRQGNDSVKEQLKGVSALLQYLQERQDFIAVIANDEHYPNGPLNFKSAVFDLLAMDGPGRRHSPENKENRVNNYILDNIVRSEDIVREGSLAEKDGLEGALKIELELVRIDAAGHAEAFKSLDEKHEMGNEFSDFTLSVNNGLNGRQAILTIIENVIRNAAKHNREALQHLENNTLLFSIIFKEVGNNYEITICSNKSEFATVKEFFETNGIISPQDGRLTPVQILSEEGGSIVRKNKGIKEMLICLAWLKYGENIETDSDNSSNANEETSEITFDTLQNAPWKLMDVVGVDNRDYSIYDCNDPHQPADLSLGYRFRIAKHRIVHLLSPAEFADESKSNDKMLDNLPSATIYAVRQSDYNKDPNNKVLAALPRLEVVTDEETEESLMDKTATLFERNIKRRFAPRLAETGGELPPLRISGEANRNFKDFDARMVVRDELGVSADRAWEQGHFGKKFVHFRTHYETRISEAFDKAPQRQHEDARAALDLNPGAIFTEGISGGNFTNTLIRTDIDRFAYCGIVEAALVQIAIVDERIFAQCQGITPKQRESMSFQPNNPRWEYWEQQGIHILNSDEKGIFDLSGHYVSTGVTTRVIYDFLSIHLGLIDKTSAKKTTEKSKLKAAIKQFGERYQPGYTKISVHSGRGGMTEMSDEIAFFPLSGIEWALNNCKFVLAEFFYGLKFPPFGDVPKKETVTAEPLKKDKEWDSKNVRVKEFTQEASSPERISNAWNSEQRVSFTNSTDSSALPVLKTNAAHRKLFFVTTHDFNKAYLASTAVDTGIVPNMEAFVSREIIREKARELSEHFERITHIDRTIFFYPCAKPRQRVLIEPERHGDFVSHLVGKVLEFITPGSNERVELHLLLHASDAAQRRTANLYESDNPLIEQIQREHPGVASVNTWWFSHDGTGIHGHVLGDNRLFDGVAGTNEKIRILLHKLAEHANVKIAGLSSNAKSYNLPPSALPTRNLPITSSASARAPGTLPFPVLHVPPTFHLNNQTYLNRLAIWQLSGASDQASLDIIFDRLGNENDFWNLRFSPEHCGKRLIAPQPLLIVGTKPLKEFGEEDRRAYYLDSSIWCRYAANEEEANNIRAQFVRNRELGLYDCYNAKEQMEFGARMLINSRFGEFEGSSHKKIVPIVFPSEGEMVKRTQEIVEEIKAEFANRPTANFPLVWKILLVDDHSYKTLSGGLCSKLAVINEVLSSLFEIEICEGNASVPPRGESVKTPCPALGDLYHIKIYCAESKEEAQDRIKRERFDIILLDYLLNKPDTFDTSVDLLLELKEAISKVKEARGPLELLWFSNVSSFANAIESRLTAKGIPQVTEEWVQNKGACAINTPELFKHNLLQFMRYQLKRLTYIPGQNEPGEYDRIVTLFDLLCVIYTEKGKIRDNAQRFFRAILKFKADYDILRKDIEYGMENEEDKRNAAKLAANPLKSEIIHSLFPDIAHYTDSFWDHLVHLVYHTAHGSPQQWPQMMVNFKEIKEVLRRTVKNNKAGMEELVKAIEGHIIALHNGKETY